MPIAQYYFLKDAILRDGTPANFRGCAWWKCLRNIHFKFGNIFGIRKIANIIYHFKQLWSKWKPEGKNLAFSISLFQKILKFWSFPFSSSTNSEIVECDGPPLRSGKGFYLACEIGAIKTPWLLNRLPWAKYGFTLITYILG